MTRPFHSQTTTMFIATSIRFGSMRDCRFVRVSSSLPNELANGIRTPAPGDAAAVPDTCPSVVRSEAAVPLERPDDDDRPSGALILPVDSDDWAPRAPLPPLPP